MKQTFVYVTDVIEFIHRYEGAPEEVCYLRYPHRHLAHIKIQVEVFHNDRELEFIMLKHKVHDYMYSIQHEANCSCEMFADKLLLYMQNNYGTNCDIIINVSEDNENGCEVVYRKEKR